MVHLYDTDYCEVEFFDVDDSIEVLTVETSKLKGCENRKD